jgi:nicotinamide-nucleotide amidase
MSELTLADEVAQVHLLLAERHQTVAVAESLTGGMLCAALTDPPGASTSFRGGLVVYATDLKERLAAVDPKLLAARGAVDPEVAVSLARGVRDRLGASWGIGITGVAGPDPQDGTPVGTVFVGVVGQSGRRPVESVAQLEVAGDRNTIRAQSVIQTVALLRTLLSQTAES